VTDEAQDSDASGAGGEKGAAGTHNSRDADEATGAADPSGSVALVWFRRDLRLHDNRALSDAATAADAVLPVYCFDPSRYGRQEYGGSDSFRYRKTGARRARFLIESVAALRSRLRAHGSGLVVRHGDPAEVVPAVAAAVGADAVYLSTYPTPEERTTESRVRERLPDRTAVHRAWTHTLYHIDDLPTTYREISDTYTAFRKAVESNASVREPLPEPEPELPGLPDGAPDPGSLPDVAELDPDLGPVPGADADSGSDRGPEPPAVDDRAVLAFEGGEPAGRDRLRGYVWERDCLREYKETRNGLIGPDYSSKLSPWLNAGCLSPRLVHREVRRYEAERVENDSTYWLLFELLWRDFFQFQFAKHGRTLFTKRGIRDRTDIDWRTSDRQLRRWQRGETGVPFVDANMRELNQTGYVSNRGRQNVASFLANNLRLDWRRGAASFERRLVDYDPCSNYGNWAYVAGVGNDSRDRYFNIVKQARRYDPDADYVRRWLPELEPLPPEYAHEPWTMSEAEQAEYGVELGVDYPEPMIDLAASYAKLR